MDRNKAIDLDKRYESIEESLLVLIDVREKYKVRRVPIEEN